MTFQIIFFTLLVLTAFYTFYRGVRLLQNKDILLSIKQEQKIYTRLSPQDKRLFGLAHVLISGAYFVALGLDLLGATPRTLYTIVWVLWAGLAFFGTSLMKRRSTYVPEEIHRPEMPTLES